MPNPIDTTWHHIRTRLITARENLDLKRSSIARRCKCARSTIDHLENGDTYTRADLLIAYAHTVGKDLTVVGPHLARIADLDDGDIVALLRAASAAASAQRLNPLESRRITELLDRVLPHHQALTNG